MIKWTLISSLRARLAGKHWIRFIKPYKMLPALGLVTIHSCFVHLHKAVYKLTGQKKMCHNSFFLQNKVQKNTESRWLAAKIYRRSTDVPNHQLSLMFWLSPPPPSPWAADVTAATLETKQTNKPQAPKTHTGATNSALRHVICSESEISSSFSSTVPFIHPHYMKPDWKKRKITWNWRLHNLCLLLLSANCDR